MKFLTGCILLFIASALAQDDGNNVNHNIINIDKF
ncbi:uncharacterized protein LOC120321788 [Drosophila yakuba]|nr:uncharacterized protein LOC120321788 [Drosophila yakuba]XP_039493202.1 uncharacterized protein LOC120452840 [Drosophila santomea]